MSIMVLYCKTIYPKCIKGYSKLFFYYFNQAGNQIKLVVLREEEGGGDITTDGEGDRTSMSSQEINSSWVGFLNVSVILYLDSCLKVCGFCCFGFYHLPIPTYFLSLNSLTNKNEYKLSL